jgi:hypothetical protein
LNGLPDAELRRCDRRIARGRIDAAAANTAVVCFVFGASGVLPLRFGSWLESGS